MYISGFSVEANRLAKVKKQKQVILHQRPYSSQLPQITDDKKKIAILSIQKQMQNQQKRHNSSNKIKLQNKLYKKIEEKNLDQNKNTSMKNVGVKKNLKLQNKSIEYQIDPNQQNKVLKYFRYYPINFIAACNKKQQLFQSLLNLGELDVIQKVRISKTEDVFEVWGKLLKLAQLKGKYKYRQKFNFMHCSQLKALKYKKKDVKRKKQSSSSDDDSDDKKQKCRDMNAWKKAMGVDGKVFIIKGRYPDLKNALLQRGWVENDDKTSQFYDFKWTTKVNDINFESLKAGQIVNHFNNNACLTSKYGLCKSLRSIMYCQSLDIDKWFPKAYDLSDLTDFQNFLQVYKWVYCQSLLKNYILGEQIDEVHVKVAIMVVERRINIVQQLNSTIQQLMKNKYPLCSINEWNLLMKAPCNIDDIIKRIEKCNLYQLNAQALQGRVQKNLDKVKQMDPQFDLNGVKNIWIIKPAFLSRGRGIKCITELNSILDYAMGKQTQYIVQKYIENPLIIDKRKFDIRQWVIIEDYNPPKIWFYGQFYLRFCMEEYSTEKINNKFAHLTNNSIQKTNKKIVGKQIDTGSMWSQQQLKHYLQTHQQYTQSFGPNPLAKIISKIKEIVIASVLSTQDQVYSRKDSFELVGYDFMLDDILNPWLIQINSSPAMDYSTAVTRRLVKMVLEDTAKVMIDGKFSKNQKKNGEKSKEYGLFKCIYKGQDFKVKHYHV